MADGGTTVVLVSSPSCAPIEDEGDSEVNENSCASCGHIKEKTRLCGRCRRVRYCSKECQLNHWKSHHRYDCRSYHVFSEEEMKKYDVMTCFDAISHLNDDLTKFALISEPYTSQGAAKHLLSLADQVQKQYEQLELEMDNVVTSLHDTFKKMNIPIPPRNQPRYKRLAQLKSKENLLSLLTRSQSNQIEVQLEAIKECRKLLSDQNPPIHELVDMGMVPVFVGFLNNDIKPKLQFEAAWILTNICSGTSEQTQEVINCGAVPQLIRLVNSKDEELAEQCVWALGNIAADSPTYRDILLEEDIVDALIPAMDSRRLTMLKNISWTMSNLCNGIQSEYWEKIVKALPKFSRLVYFTDDEILKDVCWSLSCISSGTKDRIQALVRLDHSICKRLVDLLMNHSSSVQHAALITIGNIVTGDDEQTQTLVNYSILKQLRSLLSHTKKNILKDTCFTISNIAAGSQNQISAIIDAKIIPALVMLFTTSTELDIKEEIAWALANALSNGTDVHITYLVDQGCVTCLCELLEYQSIIEPNTVDAILDALENVYKAGEYLISQSLRRSNIYTPHLLSAAVTPLLKLEIGNKEKRENLLAFIMK